MDCSPPVSSLCGFLQARILERVAISFSKGSPQPRVHTHVPYIAGRILTAWATRKPWNNWISICKPITKLYSSHHTQNINCVFSKTTTIKKWKDMDATWMQLDIIILSNISQKVKDKYHAMSFLYVESKIWQKWTFYETEKEALT